MSVEDDEADLKDQLLRALEENGFLSKLRAKLRAGVYLALEEQPVAKQKLALKSKKIAEFSDSKEGRESLALVYDLCKQFHLSATLSVLTKEANIDESILESLPVKSASSPALVELLRTRGGVKEPLSPIRKSGEEVVKKLVKVDAIEAKSPKSKKSPKEEKIEESLKKQVLEESGLKKLTKEDPIDRTELKPLNKKPLVKEDTIDNTEVFAKSKHSDWLSGSSNEPLAQLTPQKKDSSLLGDLPQMGTPSQNSGTPAKSFLSDLPQLKSNLPPLNGAKSSLAGSGNFMKLLNDSLEKIESDDKEPDKYSSDDEEESESESKTASPKPEMKLEKQEKVPEKSEPKQQTAPTKTGIFKRESPRDTTEESISEIVENLEVDDLLNSGRSDTSF